jgi:hypothetical protein
MKWINSNERLPVGVTSFKTMSDWVAVKVYSTYNKMEVTACARYCHDRHKWFVSGGHANDEKVVTKWLDECE